MPAASSDRSEVLEARTAELDADLRSAHEHARAVDLSPGQQLLLLALNSLPLLQLVSIAVLVFLPPLSLGWGLVAGAGLLYLMPPLAARSILLFCGRREGRITIGSRDFFVWWALLNLQVIFCRFPVLEELLRLVPGLYSAWLRLWGARIGRLTYWAPGTRILDRPFLEIGDDVIFGAGARLNAHVLARDPSGDLELLLATITIGARSMIGGYSLLTAGTQIAPDESTRAFLVSPPFSQWKDGRRVKDQRSAP